MSKWREKVVKLECGCKIGGNKGGPYFYNYICDKHIEEVYSIEVFWECYACYRRFIVESNGREHVRNFNHYGLHQRRKRKYDYDKALKLTDELNKKIREGKLKLEVNQENV